MTDMDSGSSKNSRGVAAMTAIKVTKMVFKLETARGVRDISTTEQLLREHILSILTKNFRLFGFQPLDTPIIERYDVLSAKFAAGEESDAMNETYRLQDNGGRELALRFDLTVPLSRYIGMNRTIPLPFSRYQIGKVYRDAPVKKGRYREFTQCDADIVGTDSVIADATCINLALAVFNDLGLDVKIKVNNRKFLNTLLTSYGVTNITSVLTTIDKMDKIGKKGVLAELENKNTPNCQAIIDDLTREGSIREKLDYFAKHDVEDLEALFKLINNKSVEFDPTITRGLGYYTGTVFEVVDASGALSSSICAGGRYDRLINEYLEAAAISTNRLFPSVGISFGLDRMVVVLHQLKNETPVSSVNVLLISKNEDIAVMRYADTLRKAGISTAIDMSGKKIGKIFSQANENNVPFVGVVGEDEVAKNILTLKNLVTGEQEELSVEQTIQKVNL